MTLKIVFGGNFERKEGAGVGRLGWLWDGGRIGTWDRRTRGSNNRQQKGQGYRGADILLVQNRDRIKKKLRGKSERGSANNEILCKVRTYD